LTFACCASAVPHVSAAVTVKAAHRIVIPPTLRAPPAIADDHAHVGAVGVV
jgi:hypothetical protein